MSDARSYNNGQVCTSSKRMIVLADRYEEVLADMKEIYSGLKWGHPLEDSTTLRPMNSQAAKEKLAKQVEAAVAGRSQGLLRVPGN